MEQPDRYGQWNVVLNPRLQKQLDVLRVRRMGFHLITCRHPSPMDVCVSGCVHLWMDDLISTTAAIKRKDRTERCFSKRR